MSGGLHADTLVPTKDQIPPRVPTTDLGTARAECAARPELGVYYHALVWDTALDDAHIRRYTARLRGAGFTARAGESQVFTAPPGGVFVNGRGQLPLSEIIVMTDIGSTLPHLTAVVWV